VGCEGGWGAQVIALVFAAMRLASAVVKQQCCAMRSHSQGVAGQVMIITGRGAGALDPNTPLNMAAQG
jgi:hypothetical protein